MRAVCFPPARLVPLFLLATLVTAVKEKPVVATTVPSASASSSQPWLSPPSSAATSPSRRPSFVTSSMTTASKASNNDDSAVLRELKDTIKTQTAEIDRLKKQLEKNSKSSSKASASHGAHGGAPPDEQDLANYVNQHFTDLALKRVFWLFLFLVSLTFTAVIMNGFEHTLAQQIELAYFVPLLAGHGGNTGGQAVGTVLSALSAHLVSLQDAPRIIAKEAMSGLVVGILLGFFVGPLAHYVLGISVPVATVIFYTLPVVSVIAASLGAVLPFACVALGLEPSVIAAPAMTSFVDVLGLLSYFVIANYVFQWFGMAL